MSDQFLAEVRMFPFNFAPRSWASCDGQLMPLSQNTALFALLGTMYGGNGQTTFALPNLLGRVPIHHGQGPGLTRRYQGEAGGSETVSLTADQLPPHTHGAPIQLVRDGVGLSSRPVGGLPGSNRAELYASDGPKTTMNPAALKSVDPTPGHPNMQPYLTVTFCIALQGIFPPRW